MNIQQLSASEKILLAEQLWESVYAEAQTIPLKDAQKAELDRRLAAYELDMQAGETWDVVRTRVVVS